jgi:peptidyl-prolyl cis-trans isomerase B (cyclophilin B)
MKQLFTILLLLSSIITQAQIGNYNGKPRYSFKAVRVGDTIGSFVVEMYPTIAPKHVRNFDSLVFAKFYDSLAFHRVIPGFVIQGGDPNSKNGPRSTWGQGQSWQKDIPAEFNPISHQRSIFSAARAADPNSANSQFFVCVAAATNLDNNYTAYGKAISGMNVVDNIVASSRDAVDNPLQKIEMFVTRIADDTTNMPTPANIIQPVNNATGISGTYQFKWNALAGALIYELEISRDANFATIDTVIKTNKLFVVVPSLQAGELQYYWRLQANNGGYKKATEIRTFTTGTFPPNLVLPTNNQVLTVNQVMFNWNGVASASSYKLQVATNPNFTLASIKVEEDSIARTSIVKSLEPNKKHFWRVASEINGIAGAYSPAFAFTTGVAVGLASEENKIISIYPNPASTELFVEGLENFEYKIYDRIGKLVLGGTSAGTAVNISGLEAGMYLLKTDKGISRFLIE